MSSDQCQILEKTKARDFRCPCGKAYLSYAALFTHIKLKHDGSAPGPITKPKNSKTKRGRPPIHLRKQQSFQLSSPSPSSSSDDEVDRRAGEEVQLASRSYFNSDISESQVCEQIGAYKRLKEWLGGQIAKVQQKSSHPVIKQCYIQFFSSIRRGLQKQVYNEIVVLFSLLSQFLADEFNDENILESAYMETVSEKINSFVLEGYEWLGERAGASRSWVLQYKNILTVLDIFFRWAQKKDYSNYRVVLKKQ